ncbi:hypothetical protein QR685DRAFT_519438 [Neurospora intermedia]|uniref:Uncharacterized protein n=1 Tax=Neurospora intermedia TaxID=5142 RepID=A0ABR3DFS4_NEUIN
MLLGLQCQQRSRHVPLHSDFFLLWLPTQALVALARTVPGITVQTPATDLLFSTCLTGISALHELLYNRDDIMPSVIFTSY